MAIVPNKDGQGIICNGYNKSIDPSYCNPYTAGTGAPSSPSIFAGQVYLNSTTGQTYRALETNTTTWMLTNPS